MRAYGLESTGRLWHDNPEGEYLTMGKIPRAAILGTIEFHDVTQPVKLLLPELAIIGDDRPNQRMRALRRDCFYFKEPAAADDAVEDILPRKDWPFTEECYQAAHQIADMFNNRDALFPLITMCLSFRKRDVSSISLSIPQLQKALVGKFPHAYNEQSCYIQDSLSQLQGAKSQNTTCSLLGTRPFL